jgi:L-asparaginase II
VNIIANVYRGGAVESSHSGHVAVVDAEGRLRYFYGDPYRMTYGRSVMKPIQAIPVITTGTAERFGLDEADLALCCGSHNGEQRHRARVYDMLRRAGQKEAVLQCGTHVPRDTESYHRLIREEKPLTPVYSNCSGKHAGMVATAVHMEEDLATYHLLDHPVQRRILDMVAEMTRYPRNRISIGVDGCSVPAHRLPLFHLAWAYARLAAPGSISPGHVREAAVRIADAMTAHPEMVAGRGRYCTDLMEAFGGRIIGKLGAEAVYCVADRERGLGIAVKIEDGAERVLYTVVNEVLRQLRIGTDGALDRLAKYTAPDVKNMSGKAVGQIQADFMLRLTDRKR